MTVARLVMQMLAALLFLVQGTRHDQHQTGHAGHPVLHTHHGHAPDAHDPPRFTNVHAILHPDCTCCLPSMATLPGTTNLPAAARGAVSSAAPRTVQACRMTLPVRARGPPVT